MRFIITITVILCLVAFTIRCERAMRTHSQTFDEAVHLAAGYSYWRSGDFRMNRETPPFPKLLWALPLVYEGWPFDPDPEQWERNDIWRLGDEFLYESRPSHEELLMPARRVNVAIGALFVLLIAWVAYRWWGRAAGIIALALAVVDPNIAAQSSILSTDVALALCCLATWYACWEYAQTPSHTKLFAAGICMGGALATKYSAGFALLGVLIGVTYWLLRGGAFAMPRTTPKYRALGALNVFVRGGLVAVAVVVVCYFVVGAPMWARGLKQQMARNDLATVRYYFLGVIDSRGWLAYFPVALALKTPLATLTLALIGLLPFSPKRMQRVDTAFLLLPPIVFLIGMAIMGVNIGFRIVMPFYPLLLLLAARSITLREGRWWKLVVLSAVMIIPLADRTHQDKPLSYFNEAIGRAHGHRYLGDSNLDWGQGLYALRTFVKAHGTPTIYLAYAGTARPEAYGIHYKRLPTWGQFQVPPLCRMDRRGPIFVAISVSNVQGTYLRDPHLYSWLQERTPLTTLDGSIWIWDISDDADAIERCERLANVPW